MEEITKQRVCYICNTELNEKNWTLSYRRYRVYRCRECNTNMIREYHEFLKIHDPEKYESMMKQRREYAKRYQREHQEKIRAYGNKHYRIYRAKIRKYVKEKRQREWNEVFDLSDEEFLNKYVRMNQ